MSRKRTISDGVVIEAACRVISKLGPAQFTLADIGAAAGIAPATLVQRFGSKRGLLLAIARMGAEGASACFDAVRAAHRSPVKALFACFDQMAGLAETPEILANNLAFLQMDLFDPEFRQWTQMNAAGAFAGYKGMLDDAVHAGELRKCDTAGLARLIQAAVHGSLVNWAFDPQGTAKEWLRRDMKMLLTPYRLPAKGS